MMKALISRRQEAALGELEPERSATELTERQLRIAERLGALSETLGDLFGAAVRHLNERRDKASIRLAAHACREIINRVPDYLDVPVAGSRLEYSQRFRKIADAWPDNLADDPSAQTLGLVKDLVEDHRTVSATQRERAESLFRALETAEVLYAGDAAARGALWIGLLGYFVGVAHVGGPAARDPDPEEFEQYFNRFERLLASQFRAEGYYESQADLDLLIQKEEPTEDDADAVVALLRGELYRTFFERAESQQWLPLLRDRGYFIRPPQRVSDGQYISFPGWPDSRYLVRLAAASPDDVATAIEGMEETDNARLHGDLLEAALAMPPAHAARIAKLAGPWLDDTFLMLVTGRAAELVAKLADGGEAAAAAQLARQLLALRESPSEGFASLGASFEVKARIDEWEYQQFLEKNFPRLVAAAPREAILLLCDVLRAVMKLERKRWQMDRDDGMKIARQRVSQHESFPAVENSLVTALRDAAVSVTAEQPENAMDIIEILEEHEDLILRRVALHLLTVADAPGFAERRTAILLDSEIAADYPLENEYEGLLERHFSDLALDDQRSILDRIEAGPPDDYRQLVTENARESGEAGEGELEERWERWRLRRSVPIKDALTGSDAERYAVRVERFGEPAYPEDFNTVAEWVGPTSSLAADEIRAKDVEEVIGFLRDWEPEGDWRGPTREGQGRALTAVVQETPETWAPHADLFRDVPPIYVRHLFDGLESAVRADKLIDSWDSILDLAEFVVAQPAGREEQTNFDDDPDFDPTRRALAHLLDTALARRVVPFPLRDRVWGIIDALAHDRDPTEEQERATRDPAGASINRTRGIAVRAAVGYGLWCARELDRAGDSFGAMPELRGLLNEKLDVQQDPSRAVRAVFGQYLPHLLYLDREWTQDNLAGIFSADQVHERYRDAAWSAFIRFAVRDGETIKLLWPQFRQAINQLSPEATERLGDDSTRLSEYIAQIYLADLDDPEDSIVDLFFQRASPAHRTHSIRNLGVTLRRGVREERRDRANELWERRLDALPDGDPELHEYGWWFSARDAAEGALHLLARTLEKSWGIIDNMKDVLETVAPLARNHPGTAIHILELMVTGSEWYMLDYARSDIRAVLEGVFAGGEQAERDGARNLIHTLGEKGVHGMQDLL
jgi:hypothetical protein